MAQKEQQAIRIMQGAPYCLFPVENEVTGSTVWYEITPSPWGMWVTVHKEKPQIVDGRPSQDTAMTTVKVDYFVNFQAGEVEQISLFAWDGQTHPYMDMSIRETLVEDVQQWRPLGEED